MPLTKNARKYTAFQTQLGLLQFKVLPFELVTAQASCSKLMRKLLKGLSNIDNFVDDIIIFISTWEQNLQVFEQLDNSWTNKEEKTLLCIYRLQTSI